MNYNWKESFLYFKLFMSEEELYNKNAPNTLTVCTNDHKPNQTQKYGKGEVL